MTVPPATPRMPRITVEHAVGALVVTLRDERGHSMGTVISPDGADALARELQWQASEARRLMAKVHPPPVKAGRLHLLVLGVIVGLIVAGFVVWAFVA